MSSLKGLNLLFTMEYEYGWNDPPKFSYSSLPTGPGKQSLLTKRVSAQTNSIRTNGPQTSTNTATSTPPTMSPVDVLHLTSGPPKILNFDTQCRAPKKSETDVVEEPATNSDSAEAGHTGDEGCDEDFNLIVERLVKLTEQYQDSIQKRTIEDIKRRLAILMKQFKEGKLSLPVQTEMIKLVSALEGGDHKAADGIHVSLMVDHVSEVSQWMVAVRKLIATIRAKS